MKNLFLIPVAALCVSGCNAPQTPTPLAQQPAPKAPIKLTATQELAKYCRVCVVDRGEKMEEFLPTRLNLQSGGHLYKFCSPPCRESFEARPERYQLPVAKTK